MTCPVCGRRSEKSSLELNCGNLEPSTLYQYTKIVGCECGHIYNSLTEEEKKGLVQYYEEDYSAGNTNSPNIDGDTPGSSNKNSLIRYRNLYEILEPFIHLNRSILDIGCAAGGFLEFLKSKRYNSLIGIDICQNFIEEALKKKIGVITYGSAEQIPLSDNSVDVIVADQVFEHLFDLNIALREIKRVLKRDGILCISVPNVRRYNEFSFFPYYWFLLREHVQHFAGPNLAAVCAAHGFIPYQVFSRTIPMLSDTTSLPCLIIIFKLIDGKVDDSDYCAASGPEVDKYISKSKKALGVIAEEISLYRREKVPLHIWGMSREFLFLYENTDLKHCNIVGLYDDTPVKQTKTVGRMRIAPSEKLFKIPDANVLITAYAHKETMVKKLYSNNFGGTLL